MKKHAQIFHIGLCLFLLLNQSIYSITLVYNLKIRRTFDVALPELLGKDHKSLYVFSAVPIIYKRDRNIINEQQLINLTDKRTTLGTLVNFRYIPSQRWWFEVSNGLEHERVESKGTLNFTKSRTALDDVIFSGGRNFFFGKRLQFVLYGLAGIPTTHKVVALEAQDTLVGTRFYSAGIGSELSCALISSLKRSFVLFFQNRFLHFFNRRWDPILPVDAKIQPGNVTDLLFSARYREKKNIFETGYNLTLFTNQGVMLQTRTITSDNWGRNSFYFNYSHLFAEVPIEKPPVLVGCGLLISRAERFDTKIFSVWGNVTVIF